MTAFDIAVLAAGAIAVVLGFRAGLLRSAVTIFGYIIALPIATWATAQIPLATASIAGQPFNQSSLVFFGLFLVVGMALGLLLRFAVDDMVGPSGLADRLGGGVLGAVRVGLIAVAMVMVFERLVPASLLPAYFADSRLRPTLSAIAASGIKALPPDVVAQIDRLKRERRI